jgi:hypothetical protein
MRAQSEASGEKTYPAAKKTYHAPKLLVYGNLTEMTLTMSGMKGLLDGGMTIGFRKTA